MILRISRFLKIAKLMIINPIINKILKISEISIKLILREKK